MAMLLPDEFPSLRFRTANVCKSSCSSDHIPATNVIEKHNDQQECLLCLPSTFRPGQGRSPCPSVQRSPRLAKNIANETIRLMTRAVEGKAIDRTRSRSARTLAQVRWHDDGRSDSQPCLGELRPGLPNVLRTC